VSTSEKRPVSPSDQTECSPARSQRPAERCARSADDGVFIVTQARPSRKETRHATLQDRPAMQVACCLQGLVVLAASAGPQAHAEGPPPEPDFFIELTVSRVATGALEETGFITLHDKALSQGG
jgi:hypothetical protein